MVKEGAEEAAQDVKFSESPEGYPAGTRRFRYHVDAVNLRASTQNIWVAKEKACICCSMPKIYDTHNWRVRTVNSSLLPSSKQRTEAVASITTRRRAVTTCRQTFESKEHNVQISLIASTLERFWRCKVRGMREFSQAPGHHPYRLGRSAAEHYRPFKIAPV